MASVDYTGDGNADVVTAAGPSPGAGLHMQYFDLNSPDFPEKAAQAASQVPLFVPASGTPDEQSKQLMDGAFRNVNGSAPPSKEDKDVLSERKSIRGGGSDLLLPYVIVDQPPGLAPPLEPVSPPPGNMPLLAGAALPSAGVSEPQANPLTQSPSAGVLADAGLGEVTLSLLELAPLDVLPSLAPNFARMILPPAVLPDETEKPGSAMAQVEPSPPLAPAPAEQDSASDHQALDAIFTDDELIDSLWTAPAL